MVMLLAIETFGLENCKNNSLNKVIMTNLTRRSFLKTSSIVSAGVFILPSLISFSPSNKLNIAVIGVII